MKTAVFAVVLLIASMDDCTVQSRAAISSKQLPSRVRVKRWLGYGGLGDPFWEYGSFHDPFGGFGGFGFPYGGFEGYGGRSRRYRRRRYERRRDYDYDVWCL